MLGLLRTLIVFSVSFHTLNVFGWQVDLIPEEERRERIRQAKKDITARLEGTK